MKNLLLVVFLASLFAIGCKQKDTQPPMIFLNGANPMKITLNSMWVDPGATVDDNRDGNTLINAITVTHNIEISGPANGEGPTKLVGSYSVIYTVKDKSDNVSSVTRTVNVVNSAEKYATKYTLYVDAVAANIIPDDTVTVDVTFDTRINNKIWFPKLGAKSGLRVGGDIIGSDTINVVAQYFDYVESSTRYLYVVSGVVNQSVILDTIDPFIKVKYNLTKYIKDVNLADLFWPLDTPQVPAAGWRLIKTDVVTDTYERF